MRWIAALYIVVVMVVSIIWPLWAAEPEALARVEAALAAGETVACEGCDLARARLSLAKLAGAALAGANLRGADLSGADLSGADLAKADLAGANLISADLSDAVLREANLTGAFLRSTRLCRTIMPDGARDDSTC